jgi:carboxymethylenebutenolidase
MNIFQNYLVEEFAEDYQEGHISRREALKLLTGVTGSLLAANTILAGCVATEPSPVATLPVSPSPSPSPASGLATGVQGQDIRFPSGNDTLIGYLARPQGDGPFPVVLVCHENRGLTEHIKDVTRRLVQAGYVALAVDLLSRHGGTASMDSSEVPGILGNISPDQFVSDFRAGWEYLKTLPYAGSDRVGMVGFCFGGGVTWLMATRMPELLAAVPFYGPHPSLESVPDIQAAVLAIYAGNDQRINQGIPAIEDAMQQNNKIYEKIIYPGVDHAFHNDTGSRYSPEAAKDAWAHTLAWFDKYVKS